MLIASLIIVSAGFLVNSWILLKIRRDARAEYANFSEKFAGFFDQQDPDTPSAFNQVVDQIAILFADRQRIAMTASMRGTQGAGVRDATRGLEEIAIEQNPALAVAELLPKHLKKNNVAQLGLSYLINQILSKQPGGSFPGSGASPGMSRGNHSNQGAFEI